MAGGTSPQEHDPLDTLFADPEIGPALKLAFYCLWRFAGARPGEIVVTTTWLGERCGRDPQTAWGWLQELQRHDLIVIGERNKRRGSWNVTVFHPCPGSREPMPDPQTRLPLAEAGDTVEVQGALGGDDREEPMPAAPTAEDETSRAGFQPETRAPDSESGGDRGPETANFSANPAHAGSVEIGARVSSPKPARLAHAPSKNSKNLAQAPCQSTIARTTNSTNSLRGPATIADLLPDVAARIASTLETAGNDRQQKERLKARFIAACGQRDPLDEWTAGCAANLVIYHGVPIRDLERILCDLDAMRRTGTLKNAARFFHGQVRKLATRLKKPWPRRKAFEKAGAGT
jgi:hypothetical protein